MSGTGYDLTFNTPFTTTDYTFLAIRTDITGGHVYSYNKGLNDWRACGY